MKRRKKTESVLIAAMNACLKDVNAGNFLSEWAYRSGLATTIVGRTDTGVNVGAAFDSIETSDDPGNGFDFRQGRLVFQCLDEDMIFNYDIVYTPEAGMLATLIMPNIDDELHLLGTRQAGR